MIDDCWCAFETTGRRKQISSFVRFLFVFEIICICFFTFVITVNISYFVIYFLLVRHPWHI